MSRATKLLERTQQAMGVNVVPVVTPATPPAGSVAAEAKVVPAVINTAPQQEYDFNEKMASDSDQPNPIPIPDTPAPETPKNVIPKELVPTDPEDDIDRMIDPKSSTQKNFHNLRTKLKSLDKDHKTVQTELENARRELKEYNDGIKVPKVLHELQEKVSQLEVYEKLFNFKGSNVYKEKFQAPITANQERLAKIAGDHAVDLTLLNKAFATDNEAEQDNVIAGAFKNPLTAMEVKNLIQGIKGKQREAAEAEKEPSLSLARMQEEENRILAERRQRKNESIKNVSKTAWAEALHILRAEDRFDHVTFKEGDTEHNEKFVRPILTKASQDFGLTMKQLAENGLEQLPGDLARKLARGDQLANYAGVVKAENDRLTSRVRELEGLLRDANKFGRPGVGNNGAGSHTGSNAGQSNASAGARVLARVTSGGR